jgi:hypothetical protein
MRPEQGWQYFAEALPAITKGKIVIPSQTGAVLARRRKVEGPAVVGSGTGHVGTAALGRQIERSSTDFSR